MLKHIALAMLLVPGTLMSCAKEASAPAAHQSNTDFSPYVLWAIQNSMPKGGGYSASPDTVNALVGNAVKWNEKKQRLEVFPLQAQPSFCSGACYLVLLKALQRWEQRTGQKLSAKAWKCFDISIDQKDGHGVWGRANANGPGLAKLVADTGTGINFTDYKSARPGDFLKIFWTNDIGRKERGHLVIYLGHEQRNGNTYIRFWSANKPGGYGVKSEPISKMKHLIFTRITQPRNFNRVTKLPQVDKLLEAMLTQEFSIQELMDMCAITKQ